MSDQPQSSADIAEVLRTVLRRFGGIPALARSEGGAEKIIAICVKEFEALTPAPAQPVAWRWRKRSGAYSMTEAGAYAEYMKGEGYEVEPLYAAQPPAAPVETKSAPAAVRESVDSTPRPPASAAMGLSAGADTRSSAGNEAALEPQASSADTVDEIAKWLHDETGHPDSYPDHTWPETDRDDGRREGGWVKIVPQHAQAYFRDIARRMVARFMPAVPQPSADTADEIERLRERCEAYKSQVEAGAAEIRRLRAVPQPSAGNAAQVFREARRFVERDPTRLSAAAMLDRINEALADTGCGTPGCTDPTCDYGKGPLRCQSCGAVVVGEPQGAPETTTALALLKQIKTANARFKLGEYAVTTQINKIIASLAVTRPKDQ